MVRSELGLMGGWEGLNGKRFLFGGMKYSKIDHTNGCIIL